MAKIFSMAGILSLFVLSISGNSFAQKHGWQLQAQAFRDQFDHSSSFKPAKGGALVMMRQLGLTPVVPLDWCRVFYGRVIWSQTNANSSRWELITC